MGQPPRFRWSREELALALKRHQFVPYFQPKVNLITGCAASVEVLARWEHPELGVIRPSEFIEQIERSNLIECFTESMLRQALASALDSAVADIDAGIAINVSTLTLQDPSVVRRLCSIVMEYAIPFERITIEVTERDTPDDFTTVMHSLTDLHTRGFRISIDDFGIGYSSLKLLSKMPFTELKIDRMFISGIFTDKKLLRIVECIMHLADRLNLTTVAEGVATKAQCDFLRTLGCDHAQGYYFAKPMKCLQAAIASVVQNNARYLYQGIEPPLCMLKFPASPRHGDSCASRLLR